MPPGNRPKPTAEERQQIRQWINASAAAYPGQFDDEYALSSILSDVQQLPEAQRPFMRYFSLHDTIPEADPAFRLQSHRDALRQAIANLSVNKQVKVTPIDAVQSIFRVDLRRGETGWGLKPFERSVKVDGKSKTEPSNVNLFDVVLIEYPFGRIYPESQSYKQLADQFLKPAAQVAPVAFVRGDWFAGDFGRSVVAKEIRYALELPDAPERDRAPIGPVTQRKSEGTPIVPLDATLKRDITPDPQPFHIMIEARDPATDLPKSKFKTGERFMIYIKPTKRVFVDLVYTGADGRCSVIDLGQHFQIDGGEEKKLHPPNAEGYRIAGEVTGREYLTLFASEEDFPRPGTLLKTKLLYDRVVHPFYALPAATENRFNPSNMVKKTIVIETSPK